MGCCEGDCSCGKGSKNPVQENLAMIQMSTSQGALSTHDWMKDLGSFRVKEEVAEVRFKNNRKAFFRNLKGIRLTKDDRVVVATSGGYDLGTISLSGERAEKKYEQHSLSSTKSDLHQIYRKATEADLNKWLEAKRRERKALLESRSIARELKLEIHISDVEFQGDGKKASIYYTADARVDFRELIRKYATSFKVRIEMKQIKTRNITSSKPSIRSPQNLLN